MFTYLYNEVFPTIEEIYVMIIGIANMPLSSWKDIFFNAYSFTEVGFFTGNAITFELGGRGLIDNIIDTFTDAAWRIFNGFVFFGIPNSTPLWLAMLLSMPQIFLASLILRWLF